MKKVILAILGIAVIGLAFAYDIATGGAMALLVPMMINDKNVSTLGEYLAAKGIKDVSTDIENANDTEKQAYYVGKLKFEAEEMGQMAKAITDGASDSNKLSEQIEELKAGKLLMLEEALKSQGAVLAAVQNGSLSATSAMEIEGNIEKAMRENAENFKNAANTKDGFSFEVKVVGDMTLAGNVSGGTMPQPHRLEGVNDIAERVTRTYPLIPKLNTDRNAIEWVYETAQEGAIAGTAEGTAKDQLDNNFVVTSVSLVKRAAYMKASTEMLTDVSFMSGWLRNKLIVRLMLDIDNQCLNGNNTPPNLNGVLNQSTTWAAGTFALAVDLANDVDSLVVGINQIKIANQGVGNLSIMMHPSDVAGLLLTKVSATDKRYVDRLITVGGTLNLDGVPIIENNNMTAGDFLIGDFSMATIVQKGSIMVEVGLDGNDFTKNMRTILAEWRGQLFIQNNDTTAFVTGTFATTNAALETT